MYGRWCLSLRLSRCDPLPRINGRIANPNCEPQVGLDSRSEHERVSLDNELSRLRLVCPSPVSDSWLMELEFVTKVTWKRELGFSSRLVTE